MYEDLWRGLWARTQQCRVYLNTDQCAPAESDQRSQFPFHIELLAFESDGYLDRPAGAIVPFAFDDRFDTRELQRTGLTGHFGKNV
jgi:hypothetical protein